jgi:hypothetical protein
MPVFSAKSEVQEQAGQAAQSIELSTLSEWTVRLRLLFHKSFTYNELPFYSSNPAAREWFCVECGHTSDHLTLEDARWELNQRDCRVPSVETLKGWADPST